ncbi:MAG TPA: hypothetical protein VJ599_06130 [Nitrososphaeraceae archaeon]|nr:hypothetical protein [Nitrososphaeraceae archaeon]
MTQEINPARNIGIIILVSVLLAQIPQQVTFANHGEEINIKFSDAQFFLLPSKNVQQVKFTTTYTVSDSDILSKQISASMKIYTENGTLIKTTSIPNGFKADKAGFQQFVTSLPASSVKEITAVVSFTELNITSPLSNSLEKKLALNQTQ